MIYFVSKTSWATLVLTNYPSPKLNSKSVKTNPSFINHLICRTYIPTTAFCRRWLKQQFCWSQSRAGGDLAGDLNSLMNWIFTNQQPQEGDVPIPLFTKGGTEFRGDGASWEQPPCGSPCAGLAVRLCVPRFPALLPTAAQKPSTLIPERGCDTRTIKRKTASGIR